MVTKVRLEGFVLLAIEEFDHERVPDFINIGDAERLVVLVNKGD